MPDLKAKPRAIAGPETLSNGGKKWSIVLDNGSMVCTFSEKCEKAVSQHIDEDLVFQVDTPDNPNLSPKVLKVLDLNGEVLWEPSAGGGGGGGYKSDPSVELAKHAVGTAGAICGNVIMAHATKGDPVPDVKALVLQAMEEWAPILHEKLRELKDSG